MKTDDAIKRLIRVSAYVLGIFIENKCSLAEVELVFRTVTEKYKLSAQLQSENILEEITHDYQNGLLP